MRIAVITCYAYRDALPAFHALLAKFWPDCPYPVTVHSDRPGEPWCSVLARLAEEAEDEEILLLLEDFYINAPVQQPLIEEALALLQSTGAGCVRLYPCPGAEVPILNNERFATIAPGTRFRISTQAAIWNPRYLWRVAKNSAYTTGEAGDFENLGSPYSDTQPESVLGFRSDAKPWPMEYLCSAISRGLWNRDAIALCEFYGIPLDLSMRGIEEEVPCLSQP